VSAVVLCCLFCIYRKHVEHTEEQLFLSLSIISIVLDEFGIMEMENRQYSDAMFTQQQHIHTVDYAPLLYDICNNSIAATHLYQHHHTKASNDRNVLQTLVLHLAHGYVVVV
jgi:hypothetical protein